MKLKILDAQFESLYPKQLYLLTIELTNRRLEIREIISHGSVVPFLNDHLVPFNEKKYHFLLAVSGDLEFLGIFGVYSNTINF